MIRWINEYLGTGAYHQIERGDFNLIDVRELVDKSGNTPNVIKENIGRIVNSLKSGRKTVVCCDYGMSRSNSLAAAALAIYMQIRFDDALSMVVKATGEQNIKTEMIVSIRYVLEGELSPRKENILVTGASGFIGSALIPKLQRYASVFSLTSCNGDLSQSAYELERIVSAENIGQIIHLANPRVYTSATAMGTSLNLLKNVIDVCKQHHIKLIFPSSWEVFSGYKERAMIVDEQTPFFPKGTFGETKMLSEQLIEHSASLYGLSFLVFRICPIYGLGSRKPAFIYTFFKKALKNEMIVTHQYRNGMSHLELLHVDDLVEIMAAAIQKELSGTYHIGSGSFHSTFEIAEVIVRTVGANSNISQLFIDDDCPGIILDDRKILKDTGMTNIKKRVFAAEVKNLVAGIV